MTYQASPIKKRTRRTKAQLAQLDEQILAVLAEDHPQSIRHVFYRMTDPRLPEPVEKTQAGYDAVQRRITDLRRSERLPYGWISDATRRGYHVDTFSGASDFVRRMAGLYRADIWKDASTYVEVWCESRSIAGVIADDCEELAVSLYPAGGFSSITLAFEAAECINYSTGRGEKPAKIMYIGDYDPAGVLIDVSIERELRQHLDRHVHLELVRIAITPGQIEALDLPTKLRKDGDRRAQHVEFTVEAEAMPARLMRKLLREHVEAYMPSGALEAAKVAEASERDYLQHVAGIMSKATQLGV